VISQSVSDKRKDILAAALRLFAEYGFHATPTSKIAKEAGVANGTLFYYYKTKEDLIVSLYIDIKSRMGEHVEAHVAAADDEKEKFRQQFIQVVLWSLVNKFEFQFLQQFQSSPYVSLLSPEDIKKQIAKTCHDIEAAIAKNLIKDRDTGFILTLMSSQLNGLNQYLSKNNLSKEKQIAVINDAFTMLWAMLA
jgi:AcrR family transcriptional regulator